MCSYDHSPCSILSACHLDKAWRRMCLGLNTEVEGFSSLVFASVDRVKAD